MQFPVTREGERERLNIFSMKLQTQPYPTAPPPYNGEIKSAEKVSDAGEAGSDSCTATRKVID